MTAELTRGVARLFRDMGLAVLPEFQLPTGRRLDLVGLNEKGRLIVAEVKSCRADFEADVKWREYLDFCDDFFFAVATDFPKEILPTDKGLIIADAYGAAIVRDAEPTPLPPARRKALTLRFARQAAGRASAL
ncbi:MAG: MmcB family DNA repair protein [Pseudomonadota bacterium]